MSKGRSLDFQEAYVVVRVDESAFYQSALEAEKDGPAIPAGDFYITIKEVVMNLEEAQAEVDRLNELGRGKKRRYFWQSTHLFTDGGSHGRKP